MAVETLKLVVNRRALTRACARASRQGIQRGGIYDVRQSSLVVWPEGPTAISEPIGMISWEWSVPAEPFATINRVEAAEGHTPDDVLAHLRRLLAPR